MSGAVQSNGDRPPVVLLGGFYPTFSIARALGSRGIAVHGLGESGNTLLSRSRFVTSYTPVPDRREERWAEWFDRGQLRGSVVMPCGDSGMEYVARNRSWLVDLGYLPTEANDDVTLAMLDKARTHELALDAGVPVPRTASVTTREDVDRVAATFEYPCALKPRDSFRFGQHFPMRKAFVVDSADELRERFEEILPTGLEMIVTEIVVSPDEELHEFCSYYSYLDEHGEPLFHFTKRKLRSYPLGWGTGTYHVTKWDPEVATLGLQFFQRSELRGIGNVEFKRDRRDGSLKLIECNPRPTQADRLLQLAGLDLGWLAYRRAIGEHVEPFGGFRDGIYQWDPRRDVRALRQGLREGSLRATAWLRSVLHTPHMIIFDPRDPGPTVALAKQYAVGLVKGKRMAAPSISGSARADATA